ncbi:hypothetical protein BJF78_10625 [Pseudonocardia sp. CNS-139]|nr:hypothetical protein BJF78_10625 [Pseudonocardia sp. CNS-139]
MPRTTALPPVARGGLALAGAVVAGVLVAVSGRYGFHRDELYFLEAGRHLAFGYVDQPPLTPLLARAADMLFGGSLVGLRLAPAIAAGLVVVVAGLMARELGGGRDAQLLAAAATGVSSVLLVTGHMLSTTTFDLLAWAAVTWLLLRALRDGGRWWLWAGLAAGIGLQNKTLVAVLLAAVGVGLLALGPRAVLRTPWPWAAVAIMLVIWAPNLVWQAVNGWPQLALSAAIAAGSSGTSEPWYVFLPFQLLLVSPLLVPVWAIGLWRLLREPALRPYRALGAAYPLLALLFTVTGGKPYYLAGLYPLLLAAGSEPVARWVRRTAPRPRAALVGLALVLSAAVNAVLMLPLVPVAQLADTPVVDVNYDAGETVGWPELVATVAAVHAGLPAAERATAVILTGNYGEAGAVDHLGRGLGLPAAYSGHNAYADWGPPPAGAAPVITVGYELERLGRWFGECTEGARVDNGVNLQNDEQGARVHVCRELRRPWSETWPQLRHVG